MSRFLKFMAVSAVLAIAAGLFFLGSMAGLFSRLSGNGVSLKEDRPHITVLKVEGPIFSSDQYMESIQRIAKDKSCKGLLLRVDSPGGAVGASQEILSALKSLKSGKLPIVVSQGNLAASGGYYVSLAGDRIFSNAGTLTGSIGVIIQFPEAVKLMDKVGVELVTVKSGALKDIGNFSRRSSPEEIRFLQSVIDNTYGQFLDDILSSRKMKREDLLKIADGRVLTGSQALDHGLVDTLGGYQEAKAYLAGLAGLEGEPIMVKEPPEKSWIVNMMESRYAGPQGLLSQAAALLPLNREGMFFLWR